MTGTRRVEAENESLLLLKLHTWASEIAPKLNMTPGEWMHLRVRHICEAVASSEKASRREHLRAVK